MKWLSNSEVHSVALSVLGLEHCTSKIDSIEAIAASIRRVAGFLCPCTANTLIRPLLEAFRGFLDNSEELKERIQDTLDAIIAYGDLLEQEDVSHIDLETKGTLLYLAPPSFVVRKSCVVLIIGIVPDRNSPLPEEMEQRIKYSKHIRSIDEVPGDDLKSYLSQLGLIELSDRNWLKLPKKVSADKHVRRLNKVLDGIPKSIELADFSVLDPKLPVNYYRGRWTEPKDLSGRFVGRRKQAYGADLWCYIEMENGRVLRILDFPLRGSRYRGCDEAWRLQAAIDALQGSPQHFKVRPSNTANTRIVDFFSPVPMWARRRWDFIGEIAETERCLFSYEFSLDEIEEELEFIKEYLWLNEIKD